MKFFLSAFLTLVFAVIGLPAQGLTLPITYTANLNGPSESPSNASPGTGFGTVVFDSIAQTLYVHVTFSGLLGTTTVSHIHAATALPLTGTAGVATQVPTFAGFPLGVTSGTYDRTFDTSLASTWNPAFINASGGTPAAAEAVFGAALADGRAYLNIHSTMFPGGEIRGFLVRSSGAKANPDLFVGNFFIPGQNVQRYNGTTGAFLSTFVPAGSGGLSAPHGGAFGPDANFYVSDSETMSIHRYNGSTGAYLNEFVSAGGGLVSPAGLVFRQGFLFVAENSAGGRVRRYNATTGAFVDNFVASGSGGLSTPEVLAFGPDGNLYVGDVDTGSVLRYNGTTGAFINAFVASGSGGLMTARGLAFGPDGNLYVSNSTFPGNILRYNGTTGAFINIFVPAGSGGLGTPRPLTFGPNGNLYVGDYGNGGVLRYNRTTGAFIDVFVSNGGGDLGGPIFMVFSPVHALAPQYLLLLD